MYDELHQSVAGLFGDARVGGSHVARMPETFYYRVDLTQSSKEFLDGMADLMMALSEADRALLPDDVVEAYEHFNEVLLHPEAGSVRAIPADDSPAESVVDTMNEFIAAVTAQSKPVYPFPWRPVLAWLALLGGIGLVIYALTS